MDQISFVFIDKDINTSVCFILLLFLSCAYLSECARAKFKFQTADNEIQNPLSVFFVDSGIACGSKCNDVNNCISYSYTASTEACKISNTDVFTSGLVSSPGSKLYVRVPKCKVSWFAFGLSCYHYSTTDKGWGSSKSYCESKGASLAIVETLEEHQYLTEVISGISAEYVWIGAKYNDTAGEHRWIDGSNITIDAWGPDKPGNSEGCVNYNRNFGWLWDSNSDCSMDVRFVCEKGR